MANPKIIKDLGDGYYLMNASGGSDLFPLNTYHSTTIHCKILTTNAVGKIAVQGSNFWNLGEDPDSVKWVNIAYLDSNQDVQDGYTMASGNANIAFSVGDNIAFEWGRLYYTRTSGTGGLTYAIRNKRR